MFANTPFGILRANFSVGIKGSFSTDLNDLPAWWNAYPVPVSVTRMGYRWLTAGKTLILKIPPVIVPSEYNVIVNSIHPDFSKIKITATEEPVIDKRIEEHL